MWHPDAAVMMLGTVRRGQKQGEGGAAMGVCEVCGNDSFYCRAHAAGVHEAVDRV